MTFVFFLMLFVFQAATGDSVAYAAGAPAMTALVIFGIQSREGITLTEDGLKVEGFRRRSFPWSSIDNIRIDPMLGARIIVICRGHDRIHLRAPATGFLQHDPDFDDKFAEIHQWWVAHRGPQWRPPEPLRPPADRRRR